ncbi:MAG: DUF1697 domain-containing protein [Carnobacterium sp.]|uniref:DUF1697 domain-containing protein n=1 Tax=Carnobacterium sp. TaxID=48221 RepID=UPI00331577E5
MQFIILLRGVNVGGKNRVPMSDLKQYLTKAGFANARSHINSGNLIVESEKDSEKDVLEKCRKILSDNFVFPIDVVIISDEKYQTELASIPFWWGEDEDYRHNALFLLPSVNKKEIAELLSIINTDYEKVYIGEQVIFWSSSFKQNYSKTYYSKLASQPFYKKVTIRNRNTTLKLLKFLEN